jgi:hypothetical protein
LLGERGVRGADVRDGLSRIGRRRAGRAQVGGEIGEPLHRDRRHDGVLALEVAVEDRLAVLDLGGQSARGHRVPAFRFGQLPGRGDDQPLSLRPLALAARLNEAMICPDRNRPRSTKESSRCR